MVISQSWTVLVRHRFIFPALMSLIFVLHATYGSAQSGFLDYIEFSRCDSLRGQLTPARTAYNVHFYNLSLTICDREKNYVGSSEIHFNSQDTIDVLQIDLHQNFTIDSIVFRGKNLTFSRECRAVFVDFPPLPANYYSKFTVHYRGEPKAANMPPWQGGAVWTLDNEGNPWYGITCQAEGASIWWPCKDHLSDQPDSMRINLTVRDGLIAVSNGKLEKSTPVDDEWTEWSWKVNYPISSYNVTYYIGNYKHHSDSFLSSSGELVPLDYYVLPENYEKSKEHFKQVHGVLEAFEHYFGPYPFPGDGFKMIETSYLGMEHQSAIAYGNRYLPGYLGMRQLPELDFDYIILHETAHEYFGNSVSCSDLGDMWIQEAFATYMEALFVEYHYGQTKAEEYMVASKRNIVNQQPIAGTLNLNFQAYRRTSDQYYKGAWMLHTLRHYINDDEMWWTFLKSLYSHFAYTTTDRYEFIEKINYLLGEDLNWFFDQYLHRADLPEFRIHAENVNNDLHLTFRWENSVSDFRLPVKVELPDGRIEKLFAANQSSTHTIKGAKKEDLRIMSETFLSDWKWLSDHSE
jgi:aminopeptidase N